MANKAIDKDYLLVQFQNFAKKIGNTFVTKETGKSLISDSDIRQIATNTQDIRQLKSSGGSGGMNEASVKLLIAEDLEALKTGASENYNTFAKISNWILNKGEQKADSFTYDDNDGSFILYAGNKILSSATIKGGSGSGGGAEDYYFVPPTFEVFFEQSEAFRFNTSGHLVMTGGKGAEFIIDPITGHLFEGKEG